MSPTWKLIGWNEVRRWLPLGAAAAAGALIASAVPAIGLATSQAVTYNACVVNRTGAIRMVSTAAPCGPGQHMISWSTGGQRPASLDNVYIDTRDTSLCCDAVELNSDGSTSTVASMIVPTGKYLVTARLLAEAVNSLGANVECFLVDSSTRPARTIDRVAALVYSNPVQEPIFLRPIVVLQGAVHVRSTSGSLLEVRCNGSDASVQNIVLSAVPAAKIIRTTG